MTKNNNHIFFNDEWNSTKPDRSHYDNDEIYQKDLKIYQDKMKDKK